MSYAIYFLTISSLTITIQCQSYRTFPPLSNLVKEQNVSTLPADSSCGIPLRSSYCRSSTSPDSVNTCILEYCDQACPLRYELPLHTDLLDASNYVCVTKDTINVGTDLTPYSALFTEGDGCYLVPLDNLKIGELGEITIGFWMRQSSANTGTIIDKVDENGVAVFSLTVSADMISLQYHTTDGVKIEQLEDIFIPPLTWTHVAIQVYMRFINVFIDGTEAGSRPVIAGLLDAPIVDREGIVRVGQRVNGTGQFVGRLQDVRVYSIALSNREIDEMMTGVLPILHTQSDCRCPGSHPRVRPSLNRYCIKNGMDDSPNDQTLRLDAYAHPLQFINDGDTNSVWISSQTSEVTITVDLGDSFQVFYVVMQFYSPLPKAVRIQRQLSDSEWYDWQYYADDCPSYFELENSGPLETSSSVNCLQLPSSESNLVPYSRGNITFNILSQAPVARPGHNDFYNTPDLYDFVKASSVRVFLKDHYYVQDPRHQYFGVYEFFVTGRCDCNGHAQTCDTTHRPYQCLCDPDSYTQGPQCSSCLPLYNDKPFRVGDQLNAYNCKPCNCYLHADTCVYNRSLDISPDNHNRGGGGQCIDCRDSTRGIHCETCIDLYYRDLNVELSSPNICLACDCDTSGTVNGTAQCELDGGQCPCKENVVGRRCDRCKAGTYSLLAANPLGCSPCMCDTEGVLNGNMNCDSSGVCSCKQNVRGDKCSLCDYGFYNLTVSNSEGCSPCECDIRGYSSPFCDPDTGQCQCKTNVLGSRCNECEDGFWDIDSNCLPCSAHCDQRGIIPDSVCDKTSGQCVCKANVNGLNCDECKPTYHSLGSSLTQGCTSCDCTLAGTVDGSPQCDQSNGQCQCKENVEGTTCNQCRAYSYGLRSDNVLGCSSCDCDPTGTVNGNLLPVDQLPCDQNNGTCTCLTNRVGRRCDTCEPTFYLNQADGGCLSCNCHPQSSLSQICDMFTGECSCKQGDVGVKGQRCDSCQPDYYNFDDSLGSCSPCNCNTSGSLNTTCDVISGQCTCKQFVQGRACDECVDGAQDLDADNPFGCSKVPSQQSAPTHRPISSTVLEISWTTPDYPNGVILKYILFRDGVSIADTPYPELSYNDTGLVPYTTYRYKVQSHNQFGYAESSEVSFRTPPGVPSGDLVLSVSDVQPDSATFSWTAVGDDMGTIEKYILTYITDIDTESTVLLYEGKSLSVSSDELSPYTNYSFTVSACTSGGCLASPPIWIITPQASPAGQGDPVVTPLSSDSFYIEWEPPSQPNGVIIFYELWLIRVEQNGTIEPSPRLIFNPSGQYSLRPRADVDNALPPPATNYTVTALQPFTRYDFQVLSQNDVSKVASNWVRATTLEAAPVFMPAPTITSINSSALHIRWVKPSKEQINGLVTVYRLLQIFDTDLVAHPFDPPTYTVEIYNSTGASRSYTVEGLAPYSTSRFIVQVCNSVGCVDSVMVSATTLPAAPSPPPLPQVSSINSTSLLVEWAESETPNGPPPTYTAVQSDVVFSVPSVRVEEGTRFSGGGYFLFPSDTVPQSVPFTGISLWFRTMQADSLLLFLSSAGAQEEFVIIQLRDGRPWFLFDPQGCITAVGIDPLTDGNITYSDGLWHQMEIERMDTQGTLTLDGNITAVEQGDCATGTIIGSNTGVYVGGLPTAFQITNQELSLQVVRQSFLGCLRDIRVMEQATPRKIWRTLDWTTAIVSKNNYATWYGCPWRLEQPATHFLGPGWLEVKSPKQIFNPYHTRIDLVFRTESANGLLLFVASRASYAYAMISQGTVVFSETQSEHTRTIRLEAADVNVCDGLWKSLAFIMSGDQMVIEAGNGYRVANETYIPGGLYMVNNLYLGGLPPNSAAAQLAEKNGLGTFIPFAGCMSHMDINNRSLDIYENTVSYSAINFDGCPPMQPSQESCRSEPQTIEIDSGESMTSAYVAGLRPFTDYLYKVTASNTAGSSETDWVVGTTREAPPYGVQAPYYAEATSGYTIAIAWSHPTGYTGLVYKYTLRGYDLQRQLAVDTTYYGSATLSGVLNGTIPYTNYSIYLEACTYTGCTQSSQGIYVKTLEETPEDVQPPYVISNSPTHMYIGWTEPTYPNGVVTGYRLYQNDILYDGILMSYNYTSLQPFTSYLLRLSACTRVGCGESSEVSLSTAQLAPSYIQAPQLIVYGTRRIDVVWSAPENLNGILTSYLIYMSTSDLTLPGHLVYNSTDVGFQTYRNESLLAGTAYYVTLGACTEGGCTLSEPANATTVGSAPDFVQDPVVTPLSSSSLLVTWSPPLHPNGIIIKYTLTQNSVEVHETVDELMYNSTDLLPYSLHVFQLQVCTAEGCTLSNEVSNRTLEDTPQGSLSLQVRPVTESREINCLWSRLDSPNGLVQYSVYFDGLYYTDVDAGNYSTVPQRRVLYNSTSADIWVTIYDLIPYSEYQVQVNASNSIGYVLSNPVSVSMPAGAPDGVIPPTLTAVNSTAITAVWGPPGRINGPAEPGVLYQLLFRSEGVLTRSIFSQLTAATTYTMYGLQPYIEYSFRLETSNGAGSSLSDWISILTLQDAPNFMDPPIILNHTSRTAELSWSEPGQANGLIVTYNVYINGSLVLSVHSNITRALVEGLNPYTTYVFTVEACTIAGCVTSASSRPIETFVDAPEGLAPPTAVSLTPTSVLLRWKEPAMPNGVLVSYTIERWISNVSSLMLYTVGLSGDMSYLDESYLLQPYTVYQYRISATTEGGTTVSDWTSVRTKSSKPSGLRAPLVEVLNATSVRVSWDPPQSTNGILERYLVKYEENEQVLVQPDILEVLLIGLTAYTNYSISVSACTDVGCTESSSVLALTEGARPGGVQPPQPIVLSQTYIAVQWEPASYPNGPSVRYSLTRMKIRQPLAVEPVGVGLWVEVYSGSQLYYEDRGVSVYTTYVYRFTVYNDFGFITSANSSAVVTHGGQPFEAPALTVTVISHTVLKADWTVPDETVLQGSVESFTLTVSNTTYTYDSGTSSAIIDNLFPNTDYTFILTLYVNGGLFIATQPITARTADGAPRGVEAPQLFVVSDTAIRVSWVEPVEPNGEIISYNIYLDGQRIPDVNSTEPGSHVVTGLSPYTIYEFKLEVCTIYACVESSTVQGTTAESQPQGFVSPQLRVLSATEVQIEWAEPEFPNGILLRYSLYRRNITSCSQLDPDDAPGLTKCDYIECSPLQTLCGQTCHDGATVCCWGVPHVPMQDYECCGTEYITGPGADDDVCCGGSFHTRVDNYECCNNRYVEVLPGQTCCANGDRVNIGYGNECCDAVPYSTGGAQICCQGVLHEAYNQQCCGDAVVPLSAVCCGDEVAGVSYDMIEARRCCGMEYVPADRTACCRSSHHQYKAHVYSSEAEMLSAGELCCELELIQLTQSCCNGRGYNPSLQVCADVGDGNLGACGHGTICPIGSNAYCDQCDFNSTLSCHVVSAGVADAVGGSPVAPSDEELCRTEPVLIYSGLQLSAIDTNLMPWSSYEYSASVTNKAGTQSTNYQPIRTAQSVPAGLAPPIATVTAGKLYEIQLDWLAPLYPNGEIVEYSLWRSTTGQAVEIHRGPELTYTDDDNIQPFITYSYTLKACTVVGCTLSDPVEVATQQAPPGGVSPPTAEFYNSTSVLLTWSTPATPNGIIHSYIIYDTVSSLRSMLVDPETLQLFFSGLEPYSEHRYVLSACTEAACTNSTALTITTLQGLPQGLSSPRTVILSSTEVVVDWLAPTQPNGMVTEYRLYRSVDVDSAMVYIGLSLTYRDSSLTPGLIYYYTVEVVNGAGSVNSSTHSVTLPTNTPSGLAPPTIAQALSPYAIYVEWDVTQNPGEVIETYQVVLNADTETVDLVEADPQVSTLSYTVTSLTPFTTYSVRIGACLKDVPNSCARGPAVYVATDEAAPVNQSAPELSAVAPDVVLVTWTSPQLPNGIILNYTVNRRLMGGENVTVYMGDNMTFSTLDTNPDFLPYTAYEYQLVVRNSAGEASSPWTQVVTSEVTPSGQGLPSVSPLGAYSVVVSWTPPTHPNGLITTYIIEYQEISQDPTFSFPIKTLTVSADVLSSTVSGLTAYTTYRIRVVVRNSAGSASSGWSQTTTGESSPDGVRLLLWTAHENGQSIRLSWLPPERPNGDITEYMIHEIGSDFPLYRGLSMEFVYLRLQPYTNYSVRLEVCTNAGCTQAPWQVVTTAEITPENQPAPTTGEVYSTMVILRWGTPLNPYGRITKHEVLRLSMGRLTKRQSSPLIVYSTNETNAEVYEYIDTELLPYSRYQYKIRSSNSKGYVESEWITVETEQDAPDGVLPPILSHHGSSYDKLLITWTEPVTANGIIQDYQLSRNQSTPWSFSALHSKEYIDTELSPFTYYSYTITACTSAGCTSSLSELILTRQSSPQSIDSPSVTPLSSTELEVSWKSPTQLNGILLQYDLLMDSNIVHTGVNTSVVIGDLAPYTQYRFTVQACTVAGCTSSIPVLARTLADVPQGLSAPVLRVVSSTAIEVSWSQPSQPNGLVHTYQVMRDGVLIYTGNSYVYTDTSLNPDTLYNYTITANNTAGTVVSPSATAHTYMSSPEGLSPPTLLPLSSTSIRVVWSPPTTSNGAITNYTLYDGFSGEILYSGLQLTTTVTGLEYFTLYTIRVQACTAVGCALSTIASVRTLEAPPSSLEKPIVTPQATATGAHAAILVVWDPPRRMNGLLKEYQLERREVISLNDMGDSYSSSQLVYNGTELRYFDDDQSLTPYTTYEYRSTVFNSIASTISDWARVRTYPGVPEQLTPPTIVAVSSTAITIRISPPSVPNGEITGYAVLVNGSQVSAEGIGLELTVSGLSPYTVYSLVYRACTSVGCALSSSTKTTTAADLPAGMTAPQVYNITGGEAYLLWTPPTHPNGPLTSYQVYQRLGCPRAYQPFYTQPCVVSQSMLIGHTLANEMTMSINDLDPYTSYQWKVEAMNDIGATVSDTWSNARNTESSEPAYRSDPGVTSELSGNEVVLDWSEAFQLNGQLIRYELYTKDLTAEGAIFLRRYSGYDTRDTFQRTSSQQDVYVSAITAEGSASSPTLRLDQHSTGLAAITTTTTSQNLPVTGFASDIPLASWLVPVLVVGILLAAILFFLLAKYCMRGKRQPYQREKTPLPKRQYRQGDFKPSSLTPIQSFHDMLTSQDAPPTTTSNTQLSSTQVAPSYNGHPQSVTSAQSSNHTAETPHGLSYSRLQNGMSLPYTSYSGPAISPSLEDMQRGATIWPTDVSLPSPLPYELDETSVLDHSSAILAPAFSVTTSHRSVTPSHRSVTPSHRSVTPSRRSGTPSQVLADSVLPKETYIGKVSPQLPHNEDYDDDSIAKEKLNTSNSDDEDVRDSVLQESGMFDDSEFSASDVEFSPQPTTFNDTHL